MEGFGFVFTGNRKGIILNRRRRYIKASCFASTLVADWILNFIAFYRSGRPEGYNTTLEIRGNYRYSVTGIINASALYHIFLFSLWQSCNWFAFQSFIYQISYKLRKGAYVGFNARLFQGCHIFCPFFNGNHGPGIAAGCKHDIH